MVRRCFLMLAGVVFVSFPLSADILTKKFDWVPDRGVQKVELDWNEIAISEIRFDLGDTVAPIRYSSAKAVVRVDNNSRKDQEVGIAIAVFDEEGTMLAAGSGGIKLGDLDKGEREEFIIRFPYVYRNMRDAKTFLLSLETKEVGRKERKVRRPAPAQE